MLMRADVADKGKTEEEKVDFYVCMCGDSE